MDVERLSLHPPEQGGSGFVQKFAIRYEAVLGACLHRFQRAVSGGDGSDTGKFEQR